VLEVAGRLDTETAPELEAALRPLLERAPANVIFDLGGVDYVSSDGIGVILGTRKTLERQGGRVLLVALKPQIEKVFRVVQALPPEGLFRDRAELDAYLTALQRPPRT
jgi:anti-anti-sigma factor